VAKRSSFSLDSFFFLQLSLGLFFMALGVMGLGDYNSRLGEVARFFGRDDSLRIVSAVIELFMGVVLLLALFLTMPKGIGRVLWVLLFALWALFILYYFVLNSLFKPDFIPWLYEVGWRSAVLVGLWIVGRTRLA